MTICMSTLKWGMACIVTDIKKEEITSQNTLFQSSSAYGVAASASNHAVSTVLVWLPVVDLCLLAVLFHYSMWHTTATQLLFCPYLPNSNNKNGSLGKAWNQNAFSGFFFLSSLVLSSVDQQIVHDHRFKCDAFCDFPCSQGVSHISWYTHCIACQVSQYLVEYVSIRQWLYHCTPTFEAWFAFSSSHVIWSSTDTSDPSHHRKFATAFSVCTSSTDCFPCWALVSCCCRVTCTSYYRASPTATHTASCTATSNPRTCSSMSRETSSWRTLGWHGHLGSPWEPTHMRWVQWLFALLLKCGGFEVSVSTGQEKVEIVVWQNLYKLHHCR